MQYMGGKTRIAKQIAAVIDEHRAPGQLVWDAFCGGLSVSVALSKKGPVLASDACAPLIALYKAVQEGWDPPTEVSRETYMAAKLLPDSDPMKAFCGFGCSFGGKWFGGYAKFSPGKFEPVYTTRGLLRDVPKIMRFDCIDFMSITPKATEHILYLDPPYKGTQAYSGVTIFDHDLLISRIVEWSQFSHIFVSEYSLSIGNIVWERGIPLQLAGGTTGNRVERLYHIPKST